MDKKAKDKIEAIMQGVRLSELVENALRKELDDWRKDEKDRRRDTKGEIIYAIDDSL